MLERLRAYFLPVETRPLPLDFELDLDASGRHILRVYAGQGPERRLVQDVPRLWRYGYSQTVSTPQRHIVYLLRPEDQQTLLALRSLNPHIGPRGELICEIEPAVLRYLRHKDNLAESSRSQAIILVEDPLRLTIEVRFDLRKGLLIQTGYRLPGLDGLVDPRHVKTTPDGRYTRVGDQYLLLAELSQFAHELLQSLPAQVPPKDIPEFLQRDLPRLRQEFNVVLLERAAQLRLVSHPLEPVVQVDKDDQGWLNFTVSYQAGEFDLPLDLLARKRSQKYFQVDETTWVRLDPAALGQAEKALQALDAQPGAGQAPADRPDAAPAPAGYRLPASEFVSLEEFIQTIGGQAHLSQTYQDFLQQLTGFTADEHFSLPTRLEELLASCARTPRPYQRAGIHWLDWLRRNGLHGVLADDMGLGKTLQSLVTLRLAYEHTHSQQHSLIVAPKSVLHQWRAELSQYFPGMRVTLYHGASRQQKVFQGSQPHIFITTYDTIARDIDSLSKVPFFYLILDEATRIKNPGAQRTQAIKALNAAHRLALSGTPVENRPAELWSLFDFLMRGHLGRYGSFVHDFEDEIVRGNAQVSEQLGRRVRPFLLRRTKQQVDDQLPEKIVLQEWCDLTKEQRRLYGGLQDEVKRVREALRQGEKVSYTANVLPVLTKLKQICDHPALATHEAAPHAVGPHSVGPQPARRRPTGIHEANFQADGRQNLAAGTHRGGKPVPLAGRSEKFDWIMDKIDEITQAGEKVIVFSHFLGMLTLLEASVRQRNIPYIRIDGASEDRERLVREFQTGGAQVALLSILAAGYGLNLQAANHVIHADRWWNPAVEDQATDRVHRLGQKRRVYVYHILVQGTLEERIDDLLQKKRGIADEIVSAAGEGPRKWSREELLELLRPLEAGAP